jgi:hypothetical protein
MITELAVLGLALRGVDLGARHRHRFAGAGGDPWRTLATFDRRLSTKAVKGGKAALHQIGA